MEETSLLALPEGIVVDQINISENGLLIEIVATSPCLAQRRNCSVRELATSAEKLLRRW